MCTPGDTIGYLKEQVALATKEEYKAGQMRMILPKDNTVLEDEDKLEKHEDEITNETELHVVFQISEGEWESVYIEDTQAAIGGERSMREDKAFGGPRIHIFFERQN